MLTPTQRIIFSAIKCTLLSPMSKPRSHIALKESMPGHKHTVFQMEILRKLIFLVMPRGAVLLFIYANWK